MPSTKPKTVDCTAFGHDSSENKSGEVKYDVRASVEHISPSTCVELGGEKSGTQGESKRGKTDEAEISFQPEKSPSPRFDAVTSSPEFFSQGNREKYTSTENAANSSFQGTCRGREATSPQMDKSKYTVLRSLGLQRKAQSEPLISYSPSLNSKEENLNGASQDIQEDSEQSIIKGDIPQEAQQVLCESSADLSQISNGNPFSPSNYVKFLGSQLTNDKHPFDASNPAVDSSDVGPSKLRVNKTEKGQKCSIGVPQPPSEPGKESPCRTCPEDANPDDLVNTQRIRIPVTEPKRSEGGTCIVRPGEPRYEGMQQPNSDIEAPKSNTNEYGNCEKETEVAWPNGFNDGEARVSAENGVENSPLSGPGAFQVYGTECNTNTEINDLACRNTGPECRNVDAACPSVDSACRNADSASPTSITTVPTFSLSDEEGEQEPGIVRAKLIRGRDSSRGHLKRLCLFSVLIVAGAVVATGVLAGRPTRDNGGDHSTSPPSSPSTNNSSGSTRLSMLRETLKPLSSDKSFSNKTSVQYKAMSWMAYGDPLQLLPENEERVIQRYSMAVLFLSMGLETFFNKNISECKWDGQEPDHVTINVAPGEENDDRIPTTENPRDDQYKNDSFDLPFGGQTDLFNIGVHCDVDQRVVALEFGRLECETGLSIPTEIRHLSMLSNLDIRTSKCYSFALDVVTNVSTLEELRFSGLNPYVNPYLVEALTLLGKPTPLRATVPTTLGKLTKLRHLDLSASTFYGGIPSELGKLEHLNQLSLKSTHVSGTIPSDMANMRNLTSMDLSSNSLRGTIPSEFGNIAHLTELRLSSNQLSGTIPSDMGRLSALKVLDLSSNKLTGTLPTALYAIERLNLEGNNLLLL